MFCTLLELKTFFNSIQQKQQDNIRKQLILKNNNAQNSIICWLINKLWWTNSSMHIRVTSINTIIKICGIDMRFIKKKKN